MALKPLVDFFFICSINTRNSLIDNIIKPRDELEKWHSPIISTLSLNTPTKDMFPSQSSMNSNSKKTSLPSRSTMGLDNLEPVLLLDHPLALKYESTITYKYPSAEIEKQDDFPPHINMFVHPNELKLEWSDSLEPQAKFHSFVITEENGTKSYGCVATVYEKLSPEYNAEMSQIIQRWKRLSVKPEDLEYIHHIQSQLNETLEKHGDYEKRLSVHPEQVVEFRDMMDLLEENKNIYTKIIQPMRKTLLATADQMYMPKSYCILSHYPFYDLFRDWLAQFLLVTQKFITQQTFTNTIPLERLVLNLLKEIPIPPPGKLEIAVSINDTLLYLHRPPVNQIPIDKNFSLFPFFSCLSNQNIVSLLECALAERKILFVSRHLEMLNYAAESLVALMYPFTWEYTYIPVLPEQLHGYLQAPVPFIVGIHGKAEDIPDDVVFVDLDRDAIRGGKLLIPPVIPSGLRKKLLNRLRKYAVVPTPRRLGEFGILYPYGKSIPSSGSLSIVGAKNHDLSSAESLETPSLKINPLGLNTTISPLSSTDRVSPTQSFFGKMRSFTFSSSLNPIAPSKSEVPSVVPSVDVKSISDRKFSSGRRTSKASDIKSKLNIKTAFDSTASLNQQDLLTPLSAATHGHEFYSRLTPTISCGFCTANIMAFGFECRECGILVHENCLDHQNIRPCAKHFNDKKIQRAFFRVFTILLKNYKAHVLIDKFPSTNDIPRAMLRRRSIDLAGLIHAEGQYADTNDVPDVWFDNEGFIASLDKDQRIFVANLVETQAFLQFTLNRIVETSKNDYETLFIDQSIIENNRAKIRIGKQTQFLTDESFSVQMTHACLAPIFSEFGQCLTEWPLKLDDSKFIAHRIIPPIVTDMDINIMRAHTTQLLQRSKIQQNKNKDIKLWFTSKFRASKNEQLLTSISLVLAGFSKQTLKSLTTEGIESALTKMHEQHAIIVTLIEKIEEPHELVEINVVLSCLVELITIYEDYHRSQLEGKVISSNHDYESERTSIFTTQKSTTSVSEIFAFSRATSLNALGQQQHSVLQVFGEDLDVPEYEESRSNKSLKSNGHNESNQLLELQSSNFEVFSAKSRDASVIDNSNTDLADNYMNEMSFFSKNKFVDGVKVYLAPVNYELEDRLELLSDCLTRETFKSIGKESNECISKLVESTSINLVREILRASKQEIFDEYLDSVSNSLVSNIFLDLKQETLKKLEQQKVDDSKNLLERQEAELSDQIESIVMCAIHGAIQDLEISMVEKSKAFSVILDQMSESIVMKVLNELKIELGPQLELLKKEISESFNDSQLSHQINECVMTVLNDASLNSNQELKTETFARSMPLQAIDKKMIIIQKSFVGDINTTSVPKEWEINLQNAVKDVDTNVANFDIQVQCIIQFAIKQAIQSIDIDFQNALDTMSFEVSQGAIIDFKKKLEEREECTASLNQCCNDLVLSVMNQVQTELNDINSLEMICSSIMGKALDSAKIDIESEESQSFCFDTVKEDLIEDISEILKAEDTLLCSHIVKVIDDNYHGGCYHNDQNSLKSEYNDITITLESISDLVKLELNELEVTGSCLDRSNEYSVNNISNDVLSDSPLDSYQDGRQFTTESLRQYSSSSVNSESQLPNDPFNESDISNASIYDSNKSKRPLSISGKYLKANSSKDHGNSHQTYDAKSVKIRPKSSIHSEHDSISSQYSRSSSIKSNTMQIESNVPEMPIINQDMIYAQTKKSTVIHPPMPHTTSDKITNLYAIPAFKMTERDVLPIQRAASVEKMEEKVVKRLGRSATVSSKSQFAVPKENEKKEKKGFFGFMRG